jgi:hypothetical protein
MIAANPLHMYTHYKSSIPVKTLSSLKITVKDMNNPNNNNNNTKKTKNNKENSVENACS